jgi:chromosomal replication initiator protein
VTRQACDQRFETFVAGEENVLAIEAAHKVIAEPGNQYNPLVLFGPPSVGKTHLFQALRCQLEETYPAWNILSLPACEFISECEQAWEKKTAAEFRQSLWTLDALMIDDIHQMVRSAPAKEELYHTFNRFVANGRQLILTSRESPADMLDLGLPLRQRLQSGLMIPMEPPREPLLRDLIERESLRFGIRLSQKAAGLLVREVRNAREIQGVFHELKQSGDSADRLIPLEDVRSVLQKHTSQQLKISDVTKVVCEYFNVELARVRSASRRQSLVQARQLAMYLVREMTGAPLTQIGDYFGGRDHTTVLYACRKVAEDVRKEPLLSQAVREVQAQLRG